MTISEIKKQTTREVQQVSYTIDKSILQQFNDLSKKYKLNKSKTVEQIIKNFIESNISKIA